MYDKVIKHEKFEAQEISLAELGGFDLASYISPTLKHKFAKRLPNVIGLI
ncbi:hypothetical protein Pgy4_29015 [Pseudomonas savastanoi pv. glycinea str. race 4]|uniref:Uncharacterized protein n=1 Tax=Pseudomonas savastanoi pv. glycinea str. race 4 TaxID=875330 RepID=F3CCR6_PSESG|nr:hypothetical protein Pgy4_29015 [Pseudomonas savastanoi pv. glycinea str. race 4]